jgi:hypothetical protein
MTPVTVPTVNKKLGAVTQDFGVDKCLKIEKPLVTAYSSTEPCPIKVIATAPSDNMRADEIAIKPAKTGKVTAVVALMSIFSKKDAICRTLN